MKGYLASKYPSGCGTYSDLKVLRSGAGWYIGTLHYHKQGFVEPGSRESDYYATREEAQAALLSGIWDQRTHP